MLQKDYVSSNLLEKLAQFSGPALTISMPTDRLSQNADAMRIAFKNLAKQGVEQLSHLMDKADLDRVAGRLADVEQDYEFWSNQAEGVIVFAARDIFHSIRLGFSVAPNVEVADRFSIRALVAARMPKEVWVLAIGDENATLYEMKASREFVTHHVPAMPQSLRDEMGELIERKRGEAKRLTSQEGWQLRLADLRVEISPSDTPLDTIRERLVPIVAKLRQDRLDRWVKTYDERMGARRATTDLQEIARAATHGQIESLAIDLAARRVGTVDSKGNVEFGEQTGPHNYDVYDEILRRAILTRASVMPIHAEEDAHGLGSPVAITLRWAN